MDSREDSRIQVWFDSHPEVLAKYTDHWVVINIRRQGVSIAEREQANLLIRIDQEKNRLYDKGQASDEVFIVHTGAFKGQEVKEG